MDHVCPPNTAKRNPGALRLPAVSVDSSALHPGYGAQQVNAYPEQNIPSGRELDSRLLGPSAGRIGLMAQAGDAGKQQGPVPDREASRREGWRKRLAPKLPDQGKYTGLLGCTRLN
jgi:hypothetical protein